MIRRLAMIAALVGAVAVAACGGDDAPQAEAPADLAPPDAPVYLEAVTRPEASAAEAITELSAKLAGIDDPLARITDELESQAADQGFDLDFDRDIEPWLGGRAALFLPGTEDSDGDPEVGFVIETTDAEAAQAFLDRAVESSGEELTEESYEGVDYLLDPDEEAAYGLVADDLVLADVRAFEAAVDAGRGDSLADDGEFEDAIEAARGESLAEVYVDLPALLERAEGSGDLPGEAELGFDLLLGADALERPLVVEADAEPDAIVVDVLLGGPGRFPTGGTSELLADVPTEATAAVTHGDLGGALEAAIGALEASGEISGAEEPGDLGDLLRSELGIDLDRALGGIGSAAVYAVPAGDSVGVGALVELTDPGPIAEALDSADALLRTLGSAGPPPRGAEAGFSVTTDDGTTVEVGSDGEVLTVTGGEDRRSAAAVRAALDGPTLEDSGRFDELRARLGEDYTPTGFGDLGELLDEVTVGLSLEGEDSELRRARPILRSLGEAIAGVREPDSSGERTAARYMITVR